MEVKQWSEPEQVDVTNIDLYLTCLVEHSRPPSRGGNTGALHAHTIFIDGVKYHFKALGSKKWVYAKDTCSFDYYEKNGHNILIKKSLTTWDSKGNEIVRGDRSFKYTLRTSAYKR